MKTETLENELKDEKRAHEEALAKYKELEEQLQRLDTHPISYYSLEVLKLGIFCTSIPTCRLDHNICIYVGLVRK